MRVAGSSGHRFVVCRPDCITWQPPEPTDETGYDVAYLGQALAYAAELLGGQVSPLTFILTWDIRTLPETGRHVVAIVQGDEDARFPVWAGEVLLTFKCYGTHPPWMPVTLRSGTLEALELLHFLRRCARWAPGALVRFWGAGRPWRRRPPVMPIPLGYYNQDEQPMVPFADRRWSVSFAGSGLAPARRPCWRGTIGTPKERSRAEMVRALAELRRTFPDEPMTTLAQPGFPDLHPAQDREARLFTRSYSELLAHTRVCLVPRGNSPETFRFFEALRAGCVVVCESLPDHWFYRGAPVVRVRRWNELSGVLTALLADPAALEQFHSASVDWWRSRCSEEALGQYMADQIGRVLADSSVVGGLERWCRDRLSRAARARSFAATVESPPPTPASVRPPRHV